MLANLVLAYDKQKKMAVYIGIASAGNIFLNYLLIPKYGIAGAAITTLIVQIIYYGQTWNMIKKINNFRLLPRLKKMVPASFIMGILAFALDSIGINVMANIIISAGFYFGVLYLAKEEIIKEIGSLFADAKINK
jgi:O-antigen/teichoic acid export membrane protein